MAESPADVAAAGDDSTRGQLSALRSLLVLSMLLTQQENQTSILNFVANAVESLGPFTLEGVFLNGGWQDVQLAGREPRPAFHPAGFRGNDDGPAAAGQLTGGARPWSWAYSLTSPHGPVGYLVVGAMAPPAQGERFLLQVLSQQAGVALANASMHRRERAQAEKLHTANRALRHSITIHDRLTQVALGGEGPPGIAQAVHELAEHPVAIEDRFGNLQAWAGPDRPDPYQREDATERDRLLKRAMAATGPVREGDRIISVAVIDGDAAGVLILHAPPGTVGSAVRMIMEHATTVLTMEIARLQGMAQKDARMRISLVLDLAAGTDTNGTGATLLSRAQAIGYDLGRPHRVVSVEAHDDDPEMDLFLHAVGRAVAATGAGSLLAQRLRDVVVLADRDVSWEHLLARVIAELNGGRCRIGVGGRCVEPAEFTRSCQEAELALRIQKAAGGQERVTLFDELGIYKILSTTGDTSAMERFVTEWLGRLIGYDSVHGTPLVQTLAEYLDRGGNYDASAQALSVHRSTLKYRLKRIREVSGHDLGLPDVQFNLQVATHAWRTLRALRPS